MKNIIKITIRWARISRIGLGIIYLVVSTGLLAGISFWIYQQEVNSIVVSREMRTFKQDYLALTPVVGYAFEVPTGFVLQVRVQNGYVVVNSAEGDAVIQYGYNWDGSLSGPEALNTGIEVVSMAAGKYFISKVEGNVVFVLRSVDGGSIQVEFGKSDAEVQRNLDLLRSQKFGGVVLGFFIAFLVNFIVVLRVLDDAPRDWFED